MKNHVGLLSLFLIFVLAFVCPFFMKVYSQRKVHPQKPQDFSSASSNFSRITADQRARLAKQRHNQVFQKFKDDSKKLSEASSQLNELIQKSSPHTYSILIVKKAEKVEKLAKRIKKRAKRGFR
jgi:type III secretory pathway component EscR